MMNQIFILACSPGFFGQNCSVACLGNSYGPQCKLTCNCNNSQTCDSKVGCVCAAGFTGDRCQTGKMNCTFPLKNLIS